MLDIPGLLHSGHPESPDDRPEQPGDGQEHPEGVCLHRHIVAAEAPPPLCPPSLSHSVPLPWIALNKHFPAGLNVSYSEESKVAAFTSYRRNADDFIRSLSSLKHPTKRGTNCSRYHLLFSKWSFVLKYIILIISDYCYANCLPLDPKTSPCFLVGST